MTNFFLFWSWKVLMSCFLSRTALNAAATFDRSSHQHQTIHEIEYCSQHDSSVDCGVWTIYSRPAVLHFKMRYYSSTIQTETIYQKNCNRHIITSLQTMSFWRKTDEMMKTGCRDENIDSWRNSMKLAKFWICGKIFDEICTSWWTKNGIFGGKIWQRSRESMS